MSIKSLVAVAMVLVSGAALAAERLGTVDNVKGLVTVTDGTVGGTAAAGAAVNDGMRFVATSSGSAILRMNNGCVVNLQPNQSVTIVKSMTCAQLLAAIQQSSGVVVAGGSRATGALAVGGLSAGGLALHRSLGHSKQLSSN